MGPEAEARAWAAKKDCDVVTVPGRIHRLREWKDKSYVLLPENEDGNIQMVKVMKEDLVLVTGVPKTFGIGWTDAYHEVHGPCRIIHADWEPLDDEDNKEEE